MPLTVKLLLVKGAVLCALLGLATVAGLQVEWQDVNGYPKLAEAAPSSLQVSSYNRNTRSLSLRWSDSVTYADAPTPTRRDDDGDLDTVCRGNRIVWTVRRSPGSSPRIWRWDPNHLDALGPRGVIATGGGTRSGSITWDERTGSHSLTVQPLQFSSYSPSHTNDDQSNCRFISATGGGTTSTTYNFPVSPSMTGTSVAVSNGQIRVTVSVANPLPSSYPVYYRYALRGSTSWSSARSVTVSGGSTTATFTATDSFLPATAYQMQTWVNGFTTATGTFTSPSTTVSGLSTVSAGLSSISLRATMQFAGSSSYTLNYRWRQSGTSSWSNGSTTVSGGSSSKTFSISGLTQATSYEIEAWVGSGTRASSTATTAATRVSNLTSTSTGISTATLRASVSNAPGGSYTISYQYKVNTSPSWSGTQTTTATGSTHSFTVSSLSSGITYDFRARVGSTTYATTSATTQLNTQVTRLALTSSTLNSLTVTATIINVPSRSYTLYYQHKLATASSWSSTSSTTVSGGSSTKAFTLAALQANTSYNVRARVGTTWVTATYITSSTRVTTLASSSATLTSVSIRASIANPPASRFTLSYRYRVAGTSSWGSTRTTSVAGNSATATFSVTGLRAGTRYDFQAWVGTSTAATLTATTNSTRVTALASTVVTSSTATLRATIADPPSSSYTLSYRFKRAADSGYGDTQTSTVTGGATTHTFTVSNLVFVTSYELQAWVGSTAATTVTFQTEPPEPMTESLVLTTRTSTRATLTVGIVNPAGTAYTLSHRFKPTASSSWSNITTNSYSGTDTTRTITLTGLMAATSYDVQAGIDAVSDQSVTFLTLLEMCTASNVSATPLGTLPETKNANLPASLPQSGTIPVTGGCVDGDNRTSHFYSFTLAEGGGVFLDVNAAENSALAPDVQLVAAPGGAVQLSNAVRTATSAKVGTVLAAGTYTVQVRPAFEQTSTNDGRHGDYLFAVRRLHPELSSLVPQTDSVQASYLVHTTAPNMETNIEYRLGNMGQWADVAGQAMYRNDPVGTEMMTPTNVVMATQTGLLVNMEYQFRAKFQHATDAQYSDVSSAITAPFVGLPAPGTPIIGSADYNEPGDPFSVLLRVSWAYPEVRVSGGGSGSNWWYNVDWGETETNNGKSLRASNILGMADIGKTLNIRSQLVVDCIDNGDATPEPCQVFLRGLTNFSDANDRIEIPEGLTVQSAWSHPVVFVVREAGTSVDTGIDPDPAGQPWVVDSINNLFISFGATNTSPETAENWALVLCLVLSLAAFAIGFLTTNQGSGDNFWAMAFGGFLFFIIWSLAGPEWFGIPAGFAYGTIAVPVMLGLIALVKQVRT